MSMLIGLLSSIKACWIQYSNQTQEIKPRLGAGAASVESAQPHVWNSVQTTLSNVCGLSFQSCVNPPSSDCFKDDTMGKQTMQTPMQHGPKNATALVVVNNARGFCALLVFFDVSMC
eukprot:m.166361 g.166361  ORF g.166361 m.166361 type:complete len:117 (-) comp31425_c2_seq1:379-729(-)